MNLTESSLSLRALARETWAVSSLQPISFTADKICLICERGVWMAPTANTYIYPHTHIQLCKYTHVQYTYTHANIYMYMYPNTHTHLYTHLYTVQLYTCRHTHVHVYSHICTHTHTYTYIALLLFIVVNWLHPTTALIFLFKHRIPQEGS